MVVEEILKNITFRKSLFAAEGNILLKQGSKRFGPFLDNFVCTLCHWSNYM